MRTRTIVSLLVLLSALSVSAASFDVPTDEEMVRSADAIVFGRVISQRAFFGDDGIPRTEVNIKVEETLKGAPERYVRVTELGGIVDGRGALTNAAAHYLDGERVLVFMRQTSPSKWKTHKADLGKFSVALTESGEERLVRGPIWTVHPNAKFSPGGFDRTVRDLEGFLQFVRDVDGNRISTRSFATDEDPGDLRIGPRFHGDPTDYTFRACCDELDRYIGVRWPDFDEGRSVGMLINGMQAGFDSNGAADRALTAWNSDPGSNVSYRRAGTTGATMSFDEPDGINVVEFNSPNARDPETMDEYLVFTWFWISDPHVFADYYFYSLSEFDIAINQDFGEFQDDTQAVLDEAMAFGMGIGLGFRQANASGREHQGTEETSVIHNPITGSFGASIGSFDREALSVIYPTGGAAPDPVINSFSASPVQIRAGSSTTLVWSTSNADDVSISPEVGTVNASGRATVMPSSTTTYTLFASNELGKIMTPHGTASTTVTVEVLQSPEIIVTSLPKQMVQGTGEGGATTTFTIQNVGGSSTTVSLSGSGGFFTVDDSSFSVAAGASHTVTITADQRDTGEYEGSIFLSGNGVRSGSRVRVKLLAVPAPEGATSAKAEDTRVDISADSGTNSGGTARFTNNGSATIVGVLVSDVPWIIPQAGLVTIQPGETVTVSFTIDRSQIPGGENIGSRTGSLQLVFRTGSTGKVGPEPHDGVSSTVSNVLVVDTTTPSTSSSDPSGIGIAEVAMFAPGVGHVVGSTGLFISDLNMTYLGSSGLLSDIDLFYSPLCGIPCPSGALNAVSSTVDTIPANTPIALADIVSSVYGEDSQLGSLQIRGASPSQLSVNAGILNLDDPAGTFGASIPILRSDRSAGPGESVFIPGLRKTANGHTNIFIQETGGGDTTVTTEYFDEDGNSLGTRTDPVPAFRVIGFFDGPGRPIGQGGTPDGAVSVVISNSITSAGKIAAYATPVDRSRPTGGDFWALVDWNRQLGQSGSDPMLIPVAGVVAGTNDTFFRTDGYAMNIGDVPGTAEVRYIYTDFITGMTNQVKTANVNVPVGATAVMEDIVATTLGVTNNSVGYIIFTPTTGTFAVTSRTYTTEAGRESTLGTGVTTLPLQGLGLGQVRRIGGIEAASQDSIVGKVPGSFRTNFALIETTGTDTVTVRATIHYDIASTSLAVARGTSSKDYTLAPGEFRQLSKIAEEIIGPARQTSLGDLHNVQAEFLVIDGAGQAAVWVSSVDNGTGDSNTRTE